MVTTLMSKNKLKSFGFANNLSKSAAFLINDIEKSNPSSSLSGVLQPVETNIVAKKRPREAADAEDGGKLLLNVKKIRVEAKPAPTTSQPAPPPPPPPPPNHDEEVVSKPRK